MIVEVDIAGSRRRVELEQRDGRWDVRIEGQRLTVDAVQIGEHWSLLIGDAVRIPERPDGWRSDRRGSYEAAVSRSGDGRATVHVGGHAIGTRVIDPRAFVRRGRDAGGARGHGARQVTAPMPGRIVKVLVNPGDRVSARQGLVVVEAMKMENELRAPADGIVREVRATEGTSVDAGTVLVVLE